MVAFVMIIAMIHQAREAQLLRRAVAGIGSRSLASMVGGRTHRKQPLQEGEHVAITQRRPEGAGFRANAMGKEVRA
jgi:hypothetical protein